MNIGVVGSRRRNTLQDFVLVGLALSELLIDAQEVEYMGSIRLVSGGCEKGADSIVLFLTDHFELAKPIIHLPVLPDDWDELVGIQRKWAYAKAAYARNKLIARDSTVLIACAALDRKGGTEDTVKSFKKLHKGYRRVILV